VTPLRERQRQRAGSATCVEDPAPCEPLLLDQPEEARTVDGGIPVPTVKIVVIGESLVGVVERAPGGSILFPWSCTRNSEA
jgi:hypothetical protein